MARPYTEHTLKLPDGIEILYTDSGAPQTADYTTLVIIHGTGFNAYGFVRLQEHAHKHNLRIVAWNRRGYHGSTKYTDEELADLKAGRKIFLDRLAVQTAWFLEHFIKHEKTPKATADRAAGGFILLGWSFGNVTALALFADPAVIPKALYETVEPHLRSLVLYDPPFQALGYPHPMPTGVYDPFKDPECTTPEELYENFKQWVASYYKHPDIATGHPSGMSFEKRTDKRTISQWTEEEKTTYCDTISAIGPDLLALVDPPVQEAIRVQAHNALFGGLVASHFPDVNVLYISGDETPYYAMWAYMESSRIYAEALKRGDLARRTTFKLVPGENHFLHYEVPDLFLREVVDGCVSE